MQDDETLFAAIRASTEAYRGLLCALARRGKHLRQSEPARAETWLAAARAHPAYKGGRLAFDLLELEDLMLDGPAPALVDEAFERRAVAAILRGVRAVSDAVLPASEAAAIGELPAQPAPEEGWPELSSAEYLYDLVVLGALRQLSRAVQEPPAPRGD